MSDTPSFTCEFCLDARQWKCKGSPCARWERDNAVNKKPAAKKAKVSTVKRVRTPEQKEARPKTGNPVGARYGVRGISKETQHAVAAALVEECDYRYAKAGIAHRFGLKVEQVRTIERGLKVLASPRR